jgi:hypothetical protein
MIARVSSTFLSAIDSLGLSPIVAYGPVDVAVVYAGFGVIVAVLLFVTHQREKTELARPAKWCLWLFRTVAVSAFVWSVFHLVIHYHWRFSRAFPIL